MWQGSSDRYGRDSRAYHQRGRLFTAREGEGKKKKRFCPLSSRLSFFGMRMHGIFSYFVNSRAVNIT